MILDEYLEYEEDILSSYDSGRIYLSTISPSEWIEQNRFMDSSVSRFKGQFKVLH